MDTLRLIALCGALVIASGDLFAEGNRPPFYERLADAALKQTERFVLYDPGYEKLPYPGGDVDLSRGVCADVVIRAYRALEIDLQVLVHEDMKEAFNQYPKIWGLTRTDTNIDHRRVPNLMTYFRRRGASLPISKSPADYLPGDLVTWTVDGNRPHIGIVARALNSAKTQPLIIHNIGWGVKLEDRLFEWPITGHFRFGER